MCIIVTPWVWAKEQEETFVCMTDSGEYEYQISLESEKRVALNSEENVVVLVEAGHSTRDRLASKKRVQTQESICDSYTRYEPLDTNSDRVSTVYFGLNSFTVGARAKQQLNQLMGTIGQKPLPLRVEGHTDSTGNRANNKALALKRANAVKEYLVAIGYSSELITASTAGQLSPKYSNETKDGRQKNRRVEIKVRATPQ